MYILNHIFEVAYHVWELQLVLFFEQLSSEGASLAWAGSDVHCKVQHAARLTRFPAA